MKNRIKVACPKCALEFDEGSIMYLCSFDSCPLGLGGANVEWEEIPPLIDDFIKDESS